MSLERSNDLAKGLILVYASSNHAMNVNYTIDCGKTSRFCNDPKNKTELVFVLRELANRIENTYPYPAQA